MSRDEQRQNSPQDQVWNRHLRGVRDVFEWLAEDLPEECLGRVQRAQRLVEDGLFSARRELGEQRRAEQRRDPQT